MENDAKQPNKILIGIIIVVILAGVTAGIVLFTRQQEAGAPSTDTPKTNTAPSTSNSTSSSTSQSTSSYKNGSYQAVGNYQTPGGSEKITVKVTLGNNGVIESVDLDRDPTTREAEEYQSKFVSGYKTQVVGKKIDDVRLSRVAGSSLTSGGFNQALESIKEEARA